MLTSYAQNFEDVILWRALKSVERGFYIDIGAQDPDTDSVSRAFYEKGWRGIHVEPNPDFAARLVSSRPDELVIRAAVSDKPGPMRFFQIASTGLSTGKPAIASDHANNGFRAEETTVEAVTLASILDDFGDREIHWLKIDVEGMEADVVRSWPPSKVRPWIVLLESTVPNATTQTHEAWEAELIALGYEFVYFDGLNRFYVSSTRPELKAAFGPGPNYFDDFALAPSAWFSRLSRGEIARLSAQEAKLAEDNAKLAAEAVARKGPTSQRVDEIAAAILSALARAQDSLGDLRGHSGHLAEIGHGLHRSIASAQAGVDNLDRRTALIEETGHAVFRVVDRSLNEILAVGGQAKLLEASTQSLHANVAAGQVTAAALVAKTEAIETVAKSTHAAVERGAADVGSLVDKVQLLEHGERAVLRTLERLAGDADQLKRRTAGLEAGLGELAGLAGRTADQSTEAASRARELESQLAGLRKELQQSRLEAAHRHEQVGRLLETLVGSLTQQTERVAVVDAEADLLRQRLGAMEQSTSWRLTAPLRALKTGIVRAPNPERQVRGPRRGLKGLIAKRVLEPALQLSLRRPRIGAAVSHTLRLVPPLYRRLKVFAHARMPPAPQVAQATGGPGWPAFGTTGGDEALSAIQVRAAQIFEDLLRQTKAS